MKHLFLTSSIGEFGVGESIRQRLGNKKKLKTAFIFTPVETEAEKSNLEWLTADRDALNKNGFITFDYSVTGKNILQINKDLADIDVLYISGGNEFYFREKCTESNFDEFVHNFVDSGGIYIGTSCGSIIAGSDISPTLKLNELEALSKPVDTHGFGLVEFTVLPHWGSVEFQQRYLSDDTFSLLYKPTNQLIALNNNEYIEVIDDKFQVVHVRGEK